MPDFIVSMLNQSGKTVYERASGPNAHAAAARLAAEGRRDVILRTDDVVATTTAFDALDKGITALELVRTIGASNSRSFFQLIVILYKRSFALVAIVYAIRVASGGSLTPSIIEFCLLLAPLAIAAFSAVFAKVNKQQALLESWAWARWQEVLDQAPSLRGVDGPSIEFKLDMREAAALAGLGRLAEGLALAERHSHSATMPRWVYFFQLADVFRAAKNEAKVLECLELAHAEDPENSTAQIALVRELLFWDRSRDRAEQLLEQLDGRYVCDYLQPALIACKGMLALNSGKSREAVSFFEESNRTLQPWAGSPTMRLAMDVTKAHLAIAYATLRHRELAERHWSSVLPRMQAIGASRIISRYQTLSFRL
jgi:hypothetical protein